MKMAIAVPAFCAAAPAVSSSACRSCSRSPLSASPGSGSKSNPTSISSYFIFKALAKPASARSPRCAKSLAWAFKERWRSAWRSWGARMAGSDLFSGDSIRMVSMPCCSAASRMRSSSTVFPTPRNPTIRMLLAGRPSRIRASAIRTVSRSSSRPASSGGGVPAPGAKGFVIGSIMSIILIFSNLSSIDTLENNRQIPPG